MIDFDYELIQGQRLEKVLGRSPLDCDDGSRSFDDILFVLENCSLHFAVNDDTDEIICQKTDRRPTAATQNESWDDVAALGECLGAKIGWLWLGNNWLGYADMIALSFAGIEPTIILVGVASKVNLYRVNKLGAR